MTLDPDRKAELLDGRLTRYTCGSCGHSATVVYPLLYHDMARQFMVWLLPRDPAGASADLPDDAGAASRIVAKTPAYRLRVVATPNELKEKVYIFDAGLDDRTIEVAKLFVTADLPATSRGTDAFFAGVEGTGDTARMQFALLTGGTQSGASLPLASTVSAVQAKYRPRETGQLWERVDRTYALSMMGTTPVPAASRLTTPTPPAPLPPGRPVTTRRPPDPVSPIVAAKPAARGWQFWRR